MLSEVQIEQYRDQGYVLVSHILSDKELDSLEYEFDGILERRARHQAGLDATWAGDWQEKYGKTSIRFAHDVQAYSAQWSRFLLHEKLTEAMSDLIGPNVQLHHTKLFYKPPQKGSGFPMHQDYPYFPHEKHTMMAGILHLTNATEANGCVRVYPGTHKKGPLDCDSRKNYLDQDVYPIEKGVACPAKRGDMLFFNYLLIHGSSPNRSNTTRKTALIQVRDPEDHPLEDSHRSHAQGLMLHGIHPLETTGMASGTLGTEQAASPKYV
jgi:ectoine hydroxylase-related dioxygenase (phytanoyl-CoA dioxygenase family)